MRLWERLQGWWNGRARGAAPAPVAERDLLLAQAITALDDARRDADARAAAAAATVDRIVAARYDRSVTTAPAAPARATSPLATESTIDDTAFLTSIGIGVTGAARDSARAGVRPLEAE